MFYLDTHRTVIQRGSSLLRERLISDREVNWSIQGKESPLFDESDTSPLPPRPKGAIQKELVTTMFEAMLGCIVDSWHVLSVKKPRVKSCEIEMVDNVAICKLVKKGKVASKSNVTRKSNPSNIQIPDPRENMVIDPINLIWWSGLTQRAIIKFKNGNMYEGDVSMACMNGQGRFQWADGTVYFGDFKDNEMVGKGVICWKDDTWYQGEFASNLRHGHGLYVDSRRQRSYTGGWHCGTKHGNGKMIYSKDIFNSYEGEWVKNLRHGFGAREYCQMSGYTGYWNTNIQDGKGLMIWPNHDCYRGDWKGGVISGNGIYIWDTTRNYSLSSPSVTTYRGDWYKGERHGYGHYNLGTGWGSCYEGQFKNNKKHGSGKLVTNNGLMLKNECLFNEDTLTQTTDDDSVVDRTNRTSIKPYYFNMCNDHFGLLYHVQQAYLNLDRQEELRAAIINEYIDNNKCSCFQCTKQTSNIPDLQTLANFVEFEKDSLYKLTKAYEPVLREIYYKYAKICNQEEIKFTPVMIRLYMWQLYFDCKIHEKGLTLVDIDNLLYDNKDWLIVTPHNPFELIYYWQFLHSLITVARKLYAIRHLPGPRPETIVAEAFKMFMEIDVLPNISNHKGHLVHGYAKFIPLQGLYNLYTNIGEPHTIHTFLRSVRRPYDFDFCQPDIQETQLDSIIEGYNAYVEGDVLAYVVDTTFVGIPKIKDRKTQTACEWSQHWSQHIPLFNFANLSSKCILEIFAKIFPGVYNSEKFVNLEYKLSFFEFFEAFVSCAIESVFREEVDMTCTSSCLSVRDLKHD